MSTQTKTCIECGIEKEFTQFRINRNGKTQYRRCKKCYHKMNWRYFKTHPVKIMVQSAKYRAKRDGLPFSLKESDITIPDVCPVLGYKLAAGDRHNHDFAPTIDRLKPELGYVAGNIIIVSYWANRIKNDATIDELVRIVNFYETAKEQQWASLIKSAL